MKQTYKKEYKSLPIEAAKLRRARQRSLYAIYNIAMAVVSILALAVAILATAFALYTILVNKDGTQPNCDRAIETQFIAQEPPTNSQPVIE